MKDEDNIIFVAKHYKRDKFSINNGWRRLGIAKFRSWRMISVAITVGLIVLSATAYVVYDNYIATSLDKTETTRKPPKSSAYIVKVIDFENTPLPKVIERIETVYGVKVTNLPDDAEKYNLSLRYEGNALDLVETINDIFEINLTVEE